MSEQIQKTKTIELSVEDATPSSGVELISKQVMESLKNDNVMATPSNYKLYYYRILEDKSELFRKQINAILEFEEESSYEKSYALQKSLYYGHSYINGSYVLAQNLVKNIDVMQIIFKKRENEFKNSNSLKTAQLKDDFKKELVKFKTSLEKKIDDIYIIHKNITTIIQNINHETMFDTTYNMHNKIYIIKMIEQEIEATDRFKHKSALIAIRLDKKILHSNHSNKVKELMNKTLARTIIKGSRRDDLVAHYDNGTFMILLKHTDIKIAQQMSQKLVNLVKNSALYLEDEEIMLAINVSIKQIMPTQNVKKHLYDSLKALDEEMAG